MRGKETEVIRGVAGEEFLAQTNSKTNEEQGMVIKGGVNYLQTLA